MFPTTSFRFSFVYTDILDEKGWNVIHHMAYSNCNKLFEGILTIDKLHIRRYLSKRAKENPNEGTYQFWLTARDNCGYMPIHIAAQFGSIDVFKTLWEMSNWEEIEKHMEHYDGNDREHLLESTGYYNRTNDGQFSYIHLPFFMYLILRKIIIETFWNLQ